MPALREADQRQPRQSVNPNKQVLDARDLAALLGESRDMVYKRLRRGSIPGILRLGRSVRVSRPVFERWLESSPPPTSRAGGRRD